MNLGALVATLGVNSAGLVKAKADMLAFEKAANSSLTRINAKLVTTGAAMKKVGKAMTMYLTLPMALVGGAAVKMHMDFESSMSKIVGLVGVAQEQVDKWSEDIITLGPQLGKAPKELADAMFFITSAGIRGAEAMDVLKMSAKASVAGLGEVKAIADLVTSAMNAYGKSVLSAEMATDVLTATVREGKAEADALATSMGMVLPIASNMGVAFREVGAAVAAMTRTGTSAATASMQLRQILASLLKPTQQAEEALGHMKTSSAALRKTIKQDGLLAALMQINKLTEQYGDTVMSKVFPNIRALSGVLDIMGANLEDNIAIFKSLEKAAGSGAKAFEAAAGTFKQKWKVATGTVTTGLTVLGNTIAEELMPILLAFGDKIRKITVWFRNLNEAGKKTVVHIGFIVMALGPLLTILGFLVGSILPRLLTMGAAAVKMFYALKIAMITNPFTAVVAAIGILVGALIILRSRTMKAKEEQKKLNAELEKAEDITNAISYKEVLRELDLLIMKKVELGKGKFIEFEALDTSKKALAKLSQELAKLPVRYLAGAKELISTEIVEVKRAMKNFVETGNTLLDQVQMQQKVEELSALTNALKTINTELEEAAKIKVLDVAVATVDPEVIITMLALSEELRFINQMTKLQGDAFDTTAAKAQIYDQALQALARKGLDETDRNMRKVLAGLQATNAELEADVFMTQVLADVDEQLAKAMDEVAQSYINATNSLANYNEKQRLSASASDLLIAKARVMEEIMYLGLTLMDRQIAKLDEQYKKDIAGAKDNVKAKERIEKEYHEKRIKLLRKAAIAEKIAGIFSIVISTAKGVMDAASKVITLPLVPWIIALGAVQAAVIAAQPLPFAAGGAVSGPTLAMVGEAPGISRSNPEFMGTAAQLGLDKIGGQNITINLKGAEIDGNKLVWLVDEIKRQQGNSY